MEYKAQFECHQSSISHGLITEEIVNNKLINGLGKQISINLLDEVNTQKINENYVFELTAYVYKKDDIKNILSFTKQNMTGPAFDEFKKLLVNE